MDLSQYIRNRTEKDAVAELLDANEGKVKLYSVVASLYNNEAAHPSGEDSFETAIPRVMNSKEFFSKNCAPAEEKFRELYDKLSREHYIRKLSSFKNIREKEGDCTLNFGIFNVTFDGNLDFLNLGYGKGWAAWAIGDNLYIGLKKIHVPLEKIVFSEDKKELCYITPRYMSSGVEYHSIIMD